MMTPTAEELKAQGNVHFKAGRYREAEASYSQAIVKNSSEAIYWRNRAITRTKLHEWEGVVNDASRSIELVPEDHRGHLLLAEAHLSLRHPNDALLAATAAHRLCVRSVSRDTAKASELYLRCKKAAWRNDERQTALNKKAFVHEILHLIEEKRDKEVDEVHQRVRDGTTGNVVADEDIRDIKKLAADKIAVMEAIFDAAAEGSLPPKEIPDYLVDTISMEIMHDPVITPNGHSYERATIMEHIKRIGTDPLTREPLTIDDLRPNIALKQACEDFWTENQGRNVNFD